MFLFTHLFFNHHILELLNGYEFEPYSIIFTLRPPLSLGKMTSHGKMSTSIVHKIHAHSHNVFHRNSAVEVHPDDPEQRQREKDYITDFEHNPEPLSPHSIAENPNNKKLGHKSQQLRLEDFQLIKTLGTGESQVSNVRAP
jgi:hypothetical protein